MTATPVATSRSLSNNHSSSPPSSLQEETAAAGDQHNTPPILWNEDNWRTNPLINPTLNFPTLVVSARELQLWMNHPLLQEHLAKPTNSEILRHIHPRIKTIRNYNDTHKLLLLKPVVRTTNSNHSDAIDDDAENDQGSKEFIQELSSLVEACNNERKNEDTTDTTVSLGSPYCLKIPYTQLSFGYILSQLLPIPPPAGYEEIGHVAHFNLKPHHLPYGKMIGQVLRETHPTIDTVVQKVGQVSGKFRTYDLEVLAGPSEYETLLVEDGIQIKVNVAECYWCTRLSGERQLLLQEIVDSANGQDLVVADVFCGVGAICMMLAKSLPNTTTILANDWNEKAIGYFRESVKLNNLNETQFKFSSTDAYDYLIDLGTSEGTTKTTTTSVPDHVLMNYPLEAPKFLGALRWWLSEHVQSHYDATARYPRFHIYTFASKEQQPVGEAAATTTTTTATMDEEEVAVNMVANELLPPMNDDNGSRRAEFNDEFDANLQTRLVRDVAPGKVVVCVSFSLTPKLIRYMQGDYS